MDRASLRFYFPEFEGRRCRFGDCSHRHEPGCEVRAAVDSGELPARRFDSYRRMYDSLPE